MSQPISTAVKIGSEAQAPDGGAIPRHVAIIGRAKQGLHARQVEGAGVVLDEAVDAQSLFRRALRHGASG